MVTLSSQDLLPAFERWLASAGSVSSAVLFGSRARTPASAAPPDKWSDIDLHVISNCIPEILLTKWSEIAPNGAFCIQILRPATGGVKKLTILFDIGEVDIVLVPAFQMRLGSIALKLGLHCRFRVLSNALNAMATPMSYGYKFLKGEREWGALYARVVAVMPGFRLSDGDVVKLADIFIVDLIHILQKLRRGELVASQRVLHQSLIETNLVLLHELRLRSGLLSIQQGRRVEQLVMPEQLKAVSIECVLSADGVSAAAWKSYDGMKKLMNELVPYWRISDSTLQLFKQYRA